MSFSDEEAKTCTLATRLELLVAEKHFRISIKHVLAFSKAVCAQALPLLYHNPTISISTIPFHIGRSYLSFGKSKEEDLRTRQRVLIDIIVAIGKLFPFQQAPKAFYDHIRIIITAHYPKWASPAYDDDCLALVNPASIYKDIMEDSDDEDGIARSSSTLADDNGEEGQMDDLEIIAEYIVIPDDDKVTIKQETHEMQQWESMIATKEEEDN